MCLKKFGALGQSFNKVTFSIPSVIRKSFRGVFFVESHSRIVKFTGYAERVGTCMMNVDSKLNFFLFIGFTRRIGN